MELIDRWFKSIEKIDDRIRNWERDKINDIEREIKKKKRRIGQIKWIIIIRDNRER